MNNKNPMYHKPSEIDLEQLAIEIRHMHRGKAIYRVLRDELSKLGFWKRKPRGNPALGLKTARENKLKGK